MQARWGTHGDHPIIVLAPASVREVFDLTVRAFNLAERFRTPVIVLYDEVIGHTHETVVLPDEVAVVDRVFPDGPPAEFLPKAASADGVPPLPAFGDGYRFHVTGLAHDERGFPTSDSAVAGNLIDRIHGKIDAHLAGIVEVESYEVDDADVVVFAYGIVARAARDAVEQARAIGLRVGLIRPVTLWPFPEAFVAEIAARVDTIVVAEMNLGQMMGEVERVVAGNARVVGCHRADGEPILPSEIFAALEQHLPDLAGDMP
jgi:2-oxoglutarate ferredoxin oxidoreductase subunit alpha